MTAETQTGGRGRRGRGWASPPGNLYASLLLVEPSPMDQLGNLPLVVGVGVAEGLARLPGIVDGEIGLKWPNDVLVAGAKCAGLLIESERLPAGLNAVAVGIGVNVEPTEADALYPIGSLRAAGFTGDIEAVFEALAAAVEAALSRWDRGRGFAAIREGWLARAVGVGTPVRVNLADRSVDGLFAELDDLGRLVLERADGSRETFSAGDLFLGARVSAPA